MGSLAEMCLLDLSPVADLVSVTVQAFCGVRSVDEL